MADQCDVETTVTHGTIAESVLRVRMEAIDVRLCGLQTCNSEDYPFNLFNVKYTASASSEAKRCSVVHCKNSTWGLTLLAIQINFWMMKLPLKPQLYQQLTDFVSRKLLNYHLTLLRRVEKGTETFMHLLRKNIEILRRRKYIFAITKSGFSGLKNIQKPFALLERNFQGHAFKKALLMQSEGRQ